MDRAWTSDNEEHRAYALARLKRSFIQRRAHKARVRQTQREYDLERRGTARGQWAGGLQDAADCLRRLAKEDA